MAKNTKLWGGRFGRNDFPIDRQLSSDLLEFKQPYTNSLDAVSDRDFILEFLSNASILMMHMSRFAKK